MSKLTESQCENLVEAVLEQLTELLGGRYTVTIVVCNGQHQDLFTNDNSYEELLEGIVSDLKQGTHEKSRSVH